MNVKAQMSKGILDEINRKGFFTAEDAKKRRGEQVPFSIKGRR